MSKRAKKSVWGATAKQGATTFWMCTGKTSHEGNAEQEERRWDNGSPTGATRWVRFFPNKPETIFVVVEE